MSNLAISDVGISVELTALQSFWNANGFLMKLFKNNVTPSKSSVLADFTEATFTGYAAQTLSAWGFPSVTAHVATITHTALVYTVSVDSPGEVVYGYYVTDGSGTNLEWAERYDSAPATMDTAGQTFTVNPQRSYESRFG